MNMNNMNMNMNNINMMNNQMMMNYLMQMNMNPQMMAMMMNNPQFMAMMNNPMMMNNPAAGGNFSIEDNQGWNLVFEKKSGGPTINLTISPEKTVTEAVNAYKLKSMEEGQMKFIFNGKELPYSLKICQSGLNNGSKILVISTKDVEGAQF